MTCDTKSLLESVDKANSLQMLQTHVRKWIEGCPTGPVSNGKGTRKASERATFMGQCMRKTEKGGQGKDMSTCSNEWKASHPKVTK